MAQRHDAATLGAQAGEPGRHATEFVLARACAGRPRGHAVARADDQLHRPRRDRHGRALAAGRTAIRLDKRFKCLLLNNATPNNN